VRISPARVLLVLAIVSTLACAQKDWIDRTLVTVDVNGTWQGTFTKDNILVRLELEQQGGTVKGLLRLVSGSSANVAGTRDGPIEGTVAGDVFRFRQTSGRAEGELRVVSEDEMDGRATISFNSYPIVFRRVAPASQEGSQPPR